MKAENLTQYIETFGPALAQKLESRFTPLVDSNYQSAYRVSMDLMREPYKAQWTVIEAIAAEWASGQQAAILSGETGSGKTLVAMTAVHLHAVGKPYRALVYSPGHLVEKWKREILATIPEARVTIIGQRADGADRVAYKHLLELRDRPSPVGPEFYIISDSRAKLGTTAVPAFVEKEIIHRTRYESEKVTILKCPCCGSRLTKFVDGEYGIVEVSMTEDDLKNKKLKCKTCDSPLYQWTKKYDRWPCSDLVSRRMRHWFKYFILDEAHTTKSETSASGNSVAQFASCIKYKLGMTGTMLNGYATSLFPTLFRLDPSRVIRLGLVWGAAEKFASRYGRLETVTVHKNLGLDNKVSKGQQVGAKQVKVKPGIMPSLYGDCLMGSTTFLQLSDLNVELPPQITNLHAIQMDEEMYFEYRSMESHLRAELAQMLRSGSKAAMSMLLNTLLCWPDHPYGFGEVRYQDKEGQWRTVCTPAELSPEVVREKERKVVEVVCDAVNRGNQCWLYTVMTQRRDVQVRLEKLLKKEGLDVRILRSKDVPPGKREAWIRENGKADTIIMHPQLVATGLDAFDAIENQFNFNCLLFYSTGYVLDTVRQASGRARRIGQWKPCELGFFYYADTMQEQAAILMSQKTKAAESLEGVFTESGLASLAGGDDNAAMALVKALVKGVR